MDLHKLGSIRGLDCLLGSLPGMLQVVQRVQVRGTIGNDAGLDANTKDSFLFGRGTCCRLSEAKESIGHCNALSYILQD